MERMEEVYCAKCECEPCQCVGINPLTIAQAEMNNAVKDFKPSPIEDIMELVKLSGAAKEVWNAAIDEAAKYLDDILETRLADDIRDMKK